MAVYVIFLAFFGIKAVCYLYFVPVVYGFQATSYITVLAHNTWLAKFGYRNFNTTDKSFNSKVAAIFCPCDGNHNNHHKYPGKYSYKVDKEVDPFGYIIGKFLVIDK